MMEANTLLDTVNHTGPRPPKLSAAWRAVQEPSQLRTDAAMTKGAV